MPRGEVLAMFIELTQSGEPALVNANMIKSVKPIAISVDEESETPVFGTIIFFRLDHSSEDDINRTDSEVFDNTLQEVKRKINAKSYYLPETYN